MFEGKRNTYTLDYEVLRVLRGLYYHVGNIR